MPDSGRPVDASSGASLECISAITLRVADMARSVRFYEALGFVRRYGGEDRSFTSYAVGEQHYLNLIHGDTPDEAGPRWGRVILHVSDVDGMYRRAQQAGLQPPEAPRDAEWGERYFHLLDPDGHELSFARRLPAE